ncbi:uncharacterized protein [Eurosta solidaginis]
MNKNYDHVNNIPSGKDKMYIISGLKSETGEKNQPLCENMNINLFSTHNSLLRKLFRNAGNPDVIYENLCRGCGYGVFEAKSNLCNFCLCVVKGLRNNQSQDSDTIIQNSANAGENIYENICFKCSALFSSDDCQCCATNENISAFDKSEETQVDNTITIPNQKNPLKIKKSKSFHKFDRHNLINGLFGSLKRGVLTRKHSLNRHEEAEDVSKKQKQLDIVHNVDGYDNIFRTNETFDLQRICQLKQAEKLRLKVSTSDQHIYGRLKLNKTNENNITEDETSHIYLSKSYEQLQVSNLEYLTTSNTNMISTIPIVQQSLPYYRKRPRISRPSFLGSRLKFVPDHLDRQKTNAILALPLSDSVCYWMKLLRKQVYNYRSYGASCDNGQYALCIPKSIPSKSTVTNTYYDDPSSGIINYNLKASPTNLEETMTNIPADKKGDFEIPMHTNNTNLQASSNYSTIYENMENQFAVMVEVFKQNIMKKHMLYQQRELKPSVEYSNSLNSIPLASSLLMRSEHKHTKYRAIHVNKENNTTFDYAPKHSPISVINSKQALSTLDMEKCSTSYCSACYVSKVKTNRCGYLSAGDCLPRTPESEFQPQTVNLLKKSQSEKTKTNQTETKVITKTETVDAYNSSSVASNISNKSTHTHIGNHSPNVKYNIGDSILIIKETNGERTSNSIHQVANLAQFIKVPNAKLSLTWNLVHLINSLLISWSLNKIILVKCSNRSQYYDWFQEWLLCHYNPWSFRAKRALRVLANHDSFDFTCKLWALLNESVKRHCNRIWKHGEQFERVCIGERPINILNAQIFMKYHCVTLQCERENEVGFDESNSEKLNVKKSIERNSQMKTNDEVILRPKSKDTLERSTKAQGKFLDHDENVSELDGNSSKLTNDKSVNNFEVDEKSDTELPPISSPLHEIGCIDIPDNCHNHKEVCIQEKEEDIYQPIWEFQTVGNVKEANDSDNECYEASYTSSMHKCLMEQKPFISDDSSIPSLLISDSVEDHGEWETDDEFMFTKKFHGYTRVGDTISSHKSSSTITSFDNSTADLCTSTASNLKHPLFRTVCIYFSLSESKIRAIVYDYDRDNASQYFRKDRHFQSLTKANENICNSASASMSSPTTRKKNLPGTSAALITSESGSTFNLKPVNAWKQNLVHPFYAEDEEDVIVSESDILRSQFFKEEYENSSVSQPKTSTLQRFKSASFDNLLDIPREDDKKSITERMRNKLQRGVFKLNMRSPKSEKKGNGIFRSVKTGSLYLEEGVRPKFPIFGAPLGQLEMNESLYQQVPRFVVDCVSYIERKEFVLQDGLYRASGNKLAIDELKKKLSESYIYDSKLLVADDIHTVTSLLKQFFRELGTPLIPQDIYDRISRGTLESAGITSLRNALEEIPDPNRSTLKFLIRHLKNVAAFSTENRMPASNLAIVWGPCIFSANQLPFVDIGRMNTLTKLLIENYVYIFRENERLVN